MNRQENGIFSKQLRCHMRSAKKLPESSRKEFMAKIPLMYEPIIEKQETNNGSELFYWVKSSDCE